MYTDGNVETQIMKRGVLDPKILPHYPYRDDAVRLYKIIRDYVTKVVDFFYGNLESRKIVCINLCSCGFQILQTPMIN